MQENIDVYVRWNDLGILVYAVPNVPEYKSRYIKCKLLEHNGKYSVVSRKEFIVNYTDSTKPKYYYKEVIQNVLSKHIMIDTGKSLDFLYKSKFEKLLERIFKCLFLHRMK